MKEKIHPKWFEATVVCSCGNTFKTGSTRERLHVEICSACHPFFTGNQKFVDTEGRVEKFMTKFGTVTSRRSKKEQERAEKARLEAQAAQQAERAQAGRVYAAAPAQVASAAASAHAEPAPADTAAAPAKRKRTTKPRTRKAKAKTEAKAAGEEVNAETKTTPVQESAT